MNYLIAIALVSSSFFTNTGSGNYFPYKLAGSVNSIAFNPDGSKLLVSMGDSTAKILDAASGDVLRVLKGHKAKVNTAYYNPDGTLIVTASEDKTAKIWNALTGEFMYDLVEKEYGISSAKFSNDGKKILTVCATAIKIWNASNATYENQLSSLPGVIFTSGCFSADSRFIFSGSSDNMVKRWVVGYEKPLATMNKHSGMVRFVSASADGKFVISAGLFDKTVYIWDAKEGYLIGNIPDQVMVQNLQCSPDGKLFLISGSGVSVFSLPECKMISDRIFDAEELIISTAIFTPDGSKVLTVSGFGTLKYWDVRTGKYLSTLK